MPPASVNSLVDDIRHRQLLDPDQVTQLVQDLQARFTDPRALAQHLLQRNWLTPYQINQLFQGQGAGLVLGQYRLLERLGEGGMGQVFKARHQALGRIVAIKVIRKDRLANADAARRFRREIQAASKLAHPNVVLAFDADEIDGVNFFAMEYVGGPDLTQIIRRQGPLPPDLACEYVRQAALGLQHAHDRGLIHRDIKPSNLLVAETGGGRPNGSGPYKPVVKILDMGLVRLVLDEDQSMLSQEGSVMGTPDFMAPEQAKNAHSVDHRADVYSLGCTLYYLLAGKVPFPGGSNIEKLLHHQTDEPAPLTEYRSDVSTGIQNAVRRMMAKQPEHRYQTAALAAEALAPFCPGATPLPAVASTAFQRAASAAPLVPPGAGPLAATVAPRTTKTPLRRTPPAPRRRLLVGSILAGVALLLLGGVGLAAYLVMPSSGKSPTGVASVPPGTPTPAPATDKRPPTSAVAVKPPQTTPERKRPPVEPWLAALPEGTTALVAVHVAQLVRTPFFKDVEGKLPVEYGSLKEDLSGLGVDLTRNVAFVAVGMSASVAGRPPDRRFMVFQGEFSRPTFEKTVRMMQLKPVDARKPTEPVYRLDQPGAPAYLAMVGESVLVFGSSAEEVAAVFERVAAARPPHHIRDKTLRGFLEKTDSPSSAIAFVSGSFVPPDQMGEPASLENLLHIRGILGVVRVVTTAECRLTIDVAGEPKAEEFDLIRRVMEDAAKKDNPFSRFVRLLTKGGGKPERNRVVYEHAFAPADASVLFPPEPGNRR